MNKPHPNKVEAFMARIQEFNPQHAAEIGKSRVVREDDFVLVGKSGNAGGTQEVYLIKSGDVEVAGRREIAATGLQEAPLMITGITILAGVQGTPTTSMDDTNVLAELQAVDMLAVEATASLKPLRNARFLLSVGGQSIFASQNFKVENCCAVGVEAKTGTYHFSQPLWIEAKKVILMSIKGDANIPQGTIIKVMLHGITTAPKNTGNAVK